MKKLTLKKIWLGAVICLLAQANVYAFVETTILEEIRANIPPQKVTQNALSRGTPATDIATQLVEAGVKPVEVAKVVTRAAPEEADHIAAVLVELAPDLAEKIIKTVIQAAKDVPLKKDALEKVALEVAIAVAKVLPPANAPKIAAIVADEVPNIAIDVVREVSLLAPDFAREISDNVIAAVGNSVGKEEISEIRRAVIEASVLPINDSVLADSVKTTTTSTTTTNTGTATTDRISVSPSR